MAEQSPRLRIAVATIGQVDLTALIEAATTEGWETVAADSVERLAGLAGSGQCEVALVACDDPLELPREAVQGLLSLVHDTVVMFLLPPQENDATRCPAIPGVTSDQIWDLDSPPQKLLAAIQQEVECALDNRPEYSVLCVDDDVEFLASMRRVLVPAAENPSRQFTLDFQFISNPTETMEKVGDLETPLAVVVSDQVMPQIQGMDLLSRVKDVHPTARRVLLTGYAGIESAIRAVNERLLDKYLTKPVENPAEFVAVIKDLARAYHLERVATRHRRRVMAQFEFIQAMTAAESLEAAQNITTTFLTRQLGAPWTALFGYEQEHFALRSTAGQPPAPQAVLHQAWKEHVRNCQRCQRRLPEAVLNWRTNNEDPEDCPSVSLAALAPLAVRHELLGVILIGTGAASQPMTRDDFLLMNSVADIAAATMMRFRHREELENTYVGTMASLMDIVEAKDSYTRGHTDRVVSLALALGKAAGLPEETLKDLRYAAALHDLGKLAVPEGVLRKPGLLNRGERAIIMEHPVRADAILKHLRFLDAARLMIRSHHERFDGTGYPNGLAGEEIPLGARILAIVDAYDAMTSSRPYRKAMTPEQALAEVRAGAGTQFDPALAALFIEMMESTKVDIQKMTKDNTSEPVEIQQS